MKDDLQRQIMTKYLWNKPINHSTYSFAGQKLTVNSEYNAY